MGKSANKGFLHDIFCLVIIQENASRDAIQISIMTPDQNAKCPRVALSGQPEKFAIAKLSADLVRQDDLASDKNSLPKAGTFFHQAASNALATQIVIITDLTVGTGRFNLAGGTVTMLMGIAGAISVAASGFIFHMTGHTLTFVIFAAVAGMATILAWLLLPETKPARYVE